jgi:hypothetical protein
VSEPAITARRPSEKTTGIDGFMGSNPSSSVYAARECKK